MRKKHRHILNKHIFNIRYQDDIYGVTVIVVNDKYYCWQTKYQIGLIYRNDIQKTIEAMINNCSKFRTDFLRGFMILFDPGIECSAKETNKYMIGG